MPDKTPREVANVMSQRARSSRIAEQTSPGPKLAKKGHDPKSPLKEVGKAITTFFIVERAAPSSRQTSTATTSSTAENGTTTSAIEQNANSPAREKDTATMPSKSKKDAVEDKTDDGSESTPPRARHYKGVLM